MYFCIYLQEFILSGKIVVKIHFFAKSPFPSLCLRMSFYNEQICHSILGKFTARNIEHLRLLLLEKNKSLQSI